MKRVAIIIVCVVEFFNSTAQTYSFRSRIEYLAAQYDAMVLKDSFIYCSGIVSDTVSPHKTVNVLSKYSPDGILLGVKIFKGDSLTLEIGTFESSLINTKDGGLALTGYTNRSDGNGFTDCLFIKYDSLLNVTNWKYYRYANQRRFFGKRIIESNDGGYFIEGTMQFTNYNIDLFLMKIDSAGNMLWRKFYGITSMNEQAEALIKTSGNRLLIAAQRDNRDISHPETFLSYCYLLLLDTAGNIVRDTVGADPNVSIPQSLIETKDGNFVFCTGYAVYKNNWIGTDFKGYAAKIDSNLNLLWERMYGDSSPVTFLYNIEELPSQELVAVGSNYNQLLHPYHNNGVIIKADADGNQIWSREYRGASRTGSSIETNELYDCDILSDGSIVACGKSQLNSSSDTFPQQAWLLRIDADGCIDNNYCGVTTIEEPKAKNQEPREIQVMPNPFIDELTVELPEEWANEKTEIAVCDALGRKVFRTSSAFEEQFKIPFHNLHAGLYYLTAAHQGIILTKKVVKE